VLTEPAQVAAFLVAVCFAAGLNVSGTVALLGLLTRVGAVTLPGDLAVLDSWWIIGLSGVLFILEVIADKLPLVDLVWNVLQTFVRVPVAGVLAYAATGTLSPGWQLLAGVLGSLLALLAHTLKTSMRTTVSASPEPVSKFGLSLAEDVFALGIVWFASAYPWAAAAIVAVTIAGVSFTVRWLFRRLRRVLRT
jgi:hypothetical protein